MNKSLLTAYFKVGNQLLREEKFEQAVINYTKVVEITPHYEAYCNMGIALKNLGLLNEAIIAYQQAIKLKPKRAETYNNIANVYATAGDTDKAIKYYERAINIKSDYAIAYDNLIELCLSLKKIKQAKALQAEVNKIIRKKNMITAHSLS
ncbi:tetratricopeptide repeat protein [Patescibacteria group bacterium]